MRFNVPLPGNTGRLGKNCYIYLLESVIIVKNLKKKHYIVVIKNAGAWGCRGGDSLPICENSLYFRYVMAILINSGNSLFRIHSSYIQFGPENPE